MPGQESLLVFAYLLKERSHVVRAKDIGILDCEGPKHFESFLRFTGEFFDAVNSFFYDIDYVRDAPATPARASFVEQRRNFFRCRTHHGNGGRLEALGRDRAWLHTRRNLFEETKPAVLALQVFAPVEPK